VEGQRSQILVSIYLSIWLKIKYNSKARVNDTRLAKGSLLLGIGSDRICPLDKSQSSASISADRYRLRRYPDDEQLSLTEKSISRLAALRLSGLRVEDHIGFRFLSQGAR
jgi:hypothetical protein